MINFAHRGASADYPENTILAFKEAIEAGADGIELDVHKSKDGKLVVIHDEDVERTFMGKGLVKDYTLSELKGLKCRKKPFRDNEEAKLPTLEEVLELLKDNDMLLNIELKTDVIHYENIENDVINLVEKYKMKERVIFSSFYAKSIEKCKEIDSSLYTGFLFDKKVDNVVEYAIKIKADAIHPNYKLIRDNLIEEAHKAGLKINTYTVNSPRVMRKLIDKGIDGAFTDYTSLLKKVIEEKDENN